MWAEIATAGLNLAPALLGKKKGPKTEVRGDELGLNHPGIDQSRLQNDPFYAEAARRANNAHIAGFTIPFAAVDRTPIWAVQRDVETHLKQVMAEGWKPPSPVTNVGDWKPFSGSPFGAQPGAVENAARSAAPAQDSKLPIYAAIGIAILAAFFLLRKG